MIFTRRRALPAALAAGVAAALLAGCSSNGAGGSSGGGGGGSSGSGKTFTIDFANYTESAPLFHVIHGNLDTALQQHPDAKVSIKWYDNGGDPGKMLQNARLMTQDKPDAIIEYPVSNATSGIGRIFSESKVPCVSVNLATPGCPFLNIDNKALGVDTGKIIGQIAKQRGWNARNTTVLVGENAAAGEQVNACVWNFYPTVAKILGLDPMEASKFTPTTTKIGTTGIQFDGGSQLQPSFQAVKNLLPGIPKNNNIILYTVNNDSTTGALRALQDAGRAGNKTLLIGGLGGDQVGIKALRTDPRWVAEGDIFVQWWGEYAVAMAQALAKGAKPPAQVTALPQVVLSKQTVDQYHQPNSVNVKQLPPLNSTNEYLKQGGLLQVIHNIKGVS